MGLIHSPRIVTDGLVLHLDAANTKSYPGSGAIWTDMSGNGKNAEFINSPTHSSENFGVFSFDGVDDYANIPEPNLTFSPNYWTFCFWIKPGNQYSRFFTPASNGVDQWIEYNPTTQKINVNITETADVNNRTRYGTDNTIPLNQWSFSCISISNLNIKIYANSVLTNESNETISIANWSSVIRLGQRGTNSNWFLGDIAVVKAYNRALTDIEIKQNFNALRGRFGL
jgi:hypothetical protein